MESTSATLLERLRNPSADASWARFVELYTPLLYHWARKIGLQDSDAADLLQDVFATLLKKLPEFTYEPGRSFRSWLRTVTLNKWRERGRRARLPLANGADPDQLASSCDAEAAWDAEYRQQLATPALAMMKADFQPAIWQACCQHTVEGKSAASVAAELGISVGAVYAAKFRVLARLREALEGLLE